MERRATAEKTRKKHVIRLTRYPLTVFLFFPFVPLLKFNEKKKTKIIKKFSVEFDHRLIWTEIGVMKSNHFENCEDLFNQ